MSATNFWNNFKNGFLDGMFFNSPLFGCFSGFNGFNNLSVFGGWNCGFMGFGGISPSLFLTPNFNAGASYQLMPDIPMPSANLNIDMSKMFNNNVWNNVQYSTTNPSFNFNSTWNNTPLNSMAWNDISTPSLSQQYTSVKSPSDKDEKITYDAAELKKTWSKKKSGLSDAFYNKVIQIAKNVNCSPNDLMALMYSESKLDATSVNSKSGATGLIQFMPDTAKGLGTSKEALKKMSAEEQLKYVEKYLLSAKKSKGFGNSQLDAGTLYALVYVPKMAKSEVIATRANDPKGWYSQNKGLDANKDGKITKSELGTRLKNYYA